MKLYIKGMFTDKRRISYQLFVSADKVVEHLMKLIQFPQAQAKNHWADEIHAFCHRVHRLKGSNKYPSFKFIYNEISSYNDILHSYITYARDTEPDEYFYDVPEHECLPTIDEYEKWLADMLSRYGEVTQQQVKQELAKLRLL